MYKTGIFEVCKITGMAIVTFVAVAKKINLEAQFNLICVAFLYEFEIIL